ncbi:MAG TPA: bifunctional serine/threonine-protein kinase/universal stress protein [Ottowia sp.]|uniref:bifunctional serine/threonine-protein kinase/universal stress protein n=1 Tax=Ottowia sp. TaxID=1898956 RepID=UPI002BD2C5F4|nr:bifunctional serine/threonine-protein kinase/universal stress protein [Ottowia sp.]HRN07354.1 bifunctional serine/threonine-protein kinase/universal stress protein [Ottowia sp.]
MKSLVPNTVIDGFKLGEMRHKGGMALIYDVAYADGRAAPFPMVMKVPRMTAGDGAETIVSFEVEHQMMQALDGPHVPHLVAAGDLSVLPYLVMEYVPGRTLDLWLDQVNQGVLLAPETLAQLGAAVAHAAHSLHEQNAVHLDLKPANVIIKGDGTAVLLDFGLSFHAHYPDLLAEETRHAVGSPAYMSPEQVVGVRGDPRSDVFAIGVMLYELATGELPFGAPTSKGGLRQRLWMDPQPPRARRPDLPEWLQEVILRCLEPAAAERYPSAAHLAFDLTHPDQVQVTERGQRLKGTGAGTHIKRWLRAAGAEYQPSPLPARQIAEVPILMVAVPHRDVTDATLYSLREAVGRSLGIRPGARLAVVTVVAPGAASTTDAGKSETALHRQMLAMLKNWTVGLKLDGHQVSYHVLEDGDPADAIVRYAETNRVGMIVMGAATHGLQLQRFVATVPIKVAMRAPCTVILVKQTMPFAELHQAGAKSEV